ncbi:MAG: DUF5657 family protein [Candidatus Roizmanbacteria bacterium]
MIEQIIAFIQTGDIISFFIKAFALILLFLYFFYAIIFLRQVQVMKGIISIRDGGILFILAYIQIIAVLVLLVYAVLIL